MNYVCMECGNEKKGMKPVRCPLCNARRSYVTIGEWETIKKMSSAELLKKAEEFGKNQIRR